jgi:hypothetical protein
MSMWIKRLLEMLRRDTTPVQISEFQRMSEALKPTRERPPPPRTAPPKVQRRAK